MNIKQSLIWEVMESWYSDRIRPFFRDTDLGNRIWIRNPVHNIPMISPVFYFRANMQHGGEGGMAEPDMDNWKGTWLPTFETPCNHLCKYYLYLGPLIYSIDYESSKFHFMCTVPSVQEVVTPFFIVSYYIKWVTTSWTYSNLIGVLQRCL